MINRPVTVLKKEMGTKVLISFYLFLRPGGEGENAARRKNKGGKALNGREERFCEEYVIDYNATKAALRAGYGKNSRDEEAAAKAAANAGSKLLKKDEIAARVREIQEEYNKARCFDEKERVLKELWVTYEKSTEAEPVMEWSTEEHSYVPTGRYQFDGKTATKALELIAKMNGMLTENVKTELSTGEKTEIEIKVLKGE